MCPSVKQTVSLTQKSFEAIHDGNTLGYPLCGYSIDEAKTNCWYEVITDLGLCYASTEGNDISARYAHAVTSFGHGTPTYFGPWPKNSKSFKEL